MTNKANKHNPKDYYRKEAKRYADFALTSFSWDYIEKPSIDKHLQHLYHRKSNVLDVGCGGGRILKHLINKGIQPTNVMGVDISEEMLAIANKNLPQVKLIRADIAKSIPISGTFDLITCSLTIQHLDEKQFAKTLDNFRKRLKNSGILFILVAHPLRVVNYDLSQYFNTGWRKQKNPWGTTMDYYHRTVSDYINKIMESRLQIISIDEPKVVSAGKKNREEYQKYSNHPARLVVVAKK